VASIDLINLESEQHLVARTENLNLLGCFGETATPFPEGTKIRLTISHADGRYVAIGKVAYSRPTSGTGIAFITIEPRSQEILDLWLAGLRK